jgi:ribosomal protein L16/L10AE
MLSLLLVEDTGEKLGKINLYKTEPFDFTSTQIQNIRAASARLFAQSNGVYEWILTDQPGTVNPSVTTTTTTVKPKL